MSAPPKTILTASCACGSVAFEGHGAPIVTLVCYCNDCKEAARQIEALPNAPRVQDADGGTGYIAYRKDRVRCSKGEPLLENRKIKENTPTNRVIATCCNSAMLLNFDDSKHWVDLYRTRVQGSAPPIEMRVCTKYATGDIPRDVPGYPGYPFKFIAKLMAARIAMLFGR
jgi:hypothetical protein